MQAVQPNIIHTVERVFVNWNTPNLRSVPFSQLQYIFHPANYMSMEEFAVDPKNIHKLDIPGGVGILMQKYNSNEKVFIAVRSE